MSKSEEEAGRKKGKEERKKKKKRKKKKSQPDGGMRFALLERTFQQSEPHGFKKKNREIYQKERKTRAMMSTNNDDGTLLTPRPA